MAIEKIKSKIVKSYLNQYPDLPDLTIAKLIYKENKLKFNSIESTRSLVRYERGHSGEKNRRQIIDKSNLTPLTHNTSPFKSPKSEAQGLQIFTLPKDRKEVLFLSDIHFPIHHEVALETAIKYGYDKKIDTIWLNGDIMDMYQASFHEKNPSNKSIFYEFEMCIDFIKELRKLFPKAQIYYKFGNHELRWERYLMIKATELFGDPEYSLPVRLHLAEHKVHWIPNSTLSKFGNLNVVHGNEFKGGGGVNPARALYLKAKDNTIAGDKHKSGENTESTLNGKIITTWSVGCLCDLNPSYFPMGHVNWNHGFAHISMNNNNFHVRNMRIWENKIL